MTEDNAGAAGESVSPSQEAPGPAARWATLLTPVASESIVATLRSNPSWQVRPIHAGFVLHGTGSLISVVAEAEVVAVEYGSRIHLALYRAPGSSTAIATCAAVTAATALPAFATWAAQAFWWPTLVLPLSGALATLVLLDRRGRRVTLAERETFVMALVKALRGKELAA